MTLGGMRSIQGRIKNKFHQFHSLYQFRWFHQFHVSIYINTTILFVRTKRFPLSLREFPFSSNPIERHELFCIKFQHKIQTITFEHRSHIPKSEIFTKDVLKSYFIQRFCLPVAHPSHSWPTLLSAPRSPGLQLWLWRLLWPLCSELHVRPEQLDRWIWSLADVTTLSFWLLWHWGWVLRVWLLFCPPVL